MPATWIATRDIPLTDLTRYPGNARRGRVAEIRASLRRHGQYRAIVVRQHDGQHTILAGNHTYDALQAEGSPTARCELIECTDDEALRINLADNRLSDLAVDDPEDMAVMLAGLDGDFEGTGWDADAFKGIQSLLEAPDLDDLGDEVGEPEDGDAWPTIRIRAPHHLVSAWNDHCKAYGDDEAAAFAQLLQLEIEP